MITRVTVVLLLAMIIGGCIARNVERRQFGPETLRSPSVGTGIVKTVDSPYLKAHMKNGNLYVFDTWRADSIPSAIAGRAALYSPARTLVMESACVVGLDSVAILEGNVLTNSGSAVAINVFTGISATVTIFCMTNPKACFGSCPTFYTTDGEITRLQAEGFSASIAPSLEATDVDALLHVRPVGGMVIVEMKNEALETHVVRHVDLLAVPQRAGMHVFAGSDGRFWECTAVREPVTAIGPKGSCREALAHMDGLERFSAADSDDLAAREEITLEFEPPGEGPCGLVLRCRQTLLQTYLLYQMLAYMGTAAGYWHAEIERGHLGDAANELTRLVGGIEVLVQGTAGEWEPVGIVNEPGPLAPDIHLIPLRTPSPGTVRVKLRMPRGTWRLDYAGLTGRVRPVEPIRLRPAIVLRDGQSSAEAQSLLSDDARSLVTVPGDRYTLAYELPDAAASYDYFLESRGYYLEWIRLEWIAEENPLLLAEMLHAPGDALRRLAPEFKRVEAGMEDCFWRSRYERP